MNSTFITSYERDAETELDFAQARYYKPSHGRFTSVDPLMASAVVTVTQSWNRYSYALNNPLKYTDPSGELPESFTAEQTRLFNTYVDSYNNSNNTSLSADQLYNQLSESQRTTFIAATHALENSTVTTTVKDAKGKAVRDENGNKVKVSVTAISLVTAVKQISGEIEGESEGRKQFRLLVDLKEGAVDQLKNSKEFSGGSSGHVYKDGIVTGAKDFRQKAGPPSLQISYLKDKRTGDIDIDYESRLSIIAHNRPPNSDIRSGDHFKEHNQQYGKENPLRNIPQKPKN